MATQLAICNYHWHLHIPLVWRTEAPFKGIIKGINKQTGASFPNKALSTLQFSSQILKISWAIFWTQHLKELWKNSCVGIFSLHQKGLTKQAAEGWLLCTQLFCRKPRATMQWLSGIYKQRWRRNIITRVHQFRPDFKSPSSLWGSYSSPCD